MPSLDIRGARLFYEIRGEGAETVLFSHGMLFSGEMFAAQVAALSDRFRCVCYDHRGQGRSSVPETGYDVESLTEDAAALIDALDLAPCHFVGLSMGGFVGMRLAARRPGLLRSLALVETSADPEPRTNLPRYRLMTLAARWLGLRAVVGRVMPIMFGASFMGDPDRAAERAAWRERIASGDRLGITRAVRGVLARRGVGHELGRIAVPVLIVVGEEDIAAPPDCARRMHALIPGARLVTIPRAGHSSTIEAPQEVSAALAGFLGGIAAPPAS